MPAPEPSVPHNGICSIELCCVSFHLCRFRPDWLRVCDPLFWHWFRLFSFFFLFLSKVMASGVWQHWQHTRRCRKNVIKKLSPHWPMCFWMWQSIRISSAKTFWMRSDLLSVVTHRQEGPLLCLLVCWLSWEAIRVISVQPLAWLTGKADGPRCPGYLCMLESYFKNVHMAGDLSITK